MDLRTSLSDRGEEAGRRRKSEDKAERCGCDGLKSAKATVATVVREEELAEEEENAWAAK